MMRDRVSVICDEGWGDEFRFSLLLDYWFLQRHVVTAYSFFLLSTHIFQYFSFQSAKTPLITQFLGLGLGKKIIDRI